MYLLYIFIYIFIYLYYIINTRPRLRPLGKKHKLNKNKTLARHEGSLLNILCRFNDSLTPCIKEHEKSGCT